MPAVICLWSSTTEDALARMLPGVVASAPEDIPVVVPQGSTTTERAKQLSCGMDAGLARTLNEATKVVEDADVVLVADACMRAPRWLERLQHAAYSDDVVGASTALSTGRDSRFGEFELGVLCDQGASRQTDDLGDPLRPYVFRLSPHCTYFRRSALSLLGPFEESLSDPAAVLAEYSARMICRGLCATLATDVWVEGLHDSPPVNARADMQSVYRLYPWLAAVRNQEDALQTGPLRRALVVARAKTRALSITVDARALGPHGGTQTHAYGLLLALAKAGKGSIRAVVRDDDVAPALISELDRAGIEVVREGEAAGLDRTDIAHRPQQAFVPEDLALLRRLGERVVITHLDLISFRNPAYHGSAQEWQRYCRLTRFALGAADRVVFLSEHAQGDAIAEELIEPQWTDVVGAAVAPADPSQPSCRPPAMASDRSFVVMIGADYLHKNRLFALELLDELRGRHGWRGLLAFAGSHVPHGGSNAQEAELLGRRPDLAAHVVDLGPVSDAEKQWLLTHAAALLCPSTYEGFGLTPLEAAAVGLPCVYPALTSLKEVVGDEAATIVPWDPVASAHRAFPLLTHGAERERHLTLLAEAAGRHTWDSIVDQLLAVYGKAVAGPYRSSVPRAWEELEREQLIVELDRARDDLNTSLLDLEARVTHGLPLIDRGGLLTRPQQRGLMRVASRRWLRGPLLGPFGLLGAIAARDRQNDG